MIKIKLSRIGRKLIPIYRIIVSNKKKDLLGFYNAKSKELTFDIEKYQKFLNLGIKPSNTVKNLYKTFIQQKN